MKMKITLLVAVVFVLAAATSLNQANAQDEATVQYQLIDLGDIGSYSYSPQPTSINDRDQITGCIGTVAGNRAFLYDNGTMINLGTLDGTTSCGLEINNSGHIVGYSTYKGGNYDYHAFLYDGNTMSDLGTFSSPWWESMAYGISDSGLITGYSEYWESPWFCPRQRAFILDGDSWTNLHALPWYSPLPAADKCGMPSLGCGINDSGQVTGWGGLYYYDEVNNKYICSHGPHAFLYDGNTMIDLGTLGGPELRSWGRAINNSGQVTGVSEIDGGHRLAFISDGTMMVSLGTLGGARSEGYDINDSGHVTGWALNAENQQEAFLYDGNNMVALSSLVDYKALGWSQLVVGKAINNIGSIAGWGYVEGDTFHRHAFLLRIWSDDKGPASSHVTLEPSVVEVGGNILLTATVDDTESGNSNIASAEYSLDGETWYPLNGTWDSPTVVVHSSVSAPSTAGIFEVCVRGTDALDNEGKTECASLIAYDPDGGFVTGGGWIDSPEGAYAQDPTLTGKATFGFVSKYKKGATEPTGNTEFQFKAGDLNFHSVSYDWLVIAGHKAMYKGVGTINGDGNFGFMLSAIDEKLTPSTDADLFRIKIWDKDDGDNLIFDNQMGEAEDAEATTEIGRGNIVIHKK